ncbi:MAG: ECF transporter S component [Erysipelotrichaceae bacterium]|nr:ECF transporter S component [Erysipelotrichaceae bacterium]
MSKNRKSLLKLTIAAMMLALAMLLPFITGQIPQIGNALSPMHIPALLCGFFCGPALGALVGFIAPLLRFALFGMPPIMPMGIAMAFELATYECARNLQGENL